MPFRRIVGAVFALLMSATLAACGPASSESTASDATPQPSVGAPITTTQAAASPPTSVNPSAEPSHAPGAAPTGDMVCAKLSPDDVANALGVSHNLTSAPGPLPYNPAPGVGLCIYSDSNGEAVRISRVISDRLWVLDTTLDKPTLVSVQGGVGANLGNHDFIAHTGKNASFVVDVRGVAYSDEQLAQLLRLAFTRLS